MNWPPITMATQHPDNACAPWWSGDPFISTAQEIDEVLELFRKLPIDEYMWDWEGKYVDEAVGEKLFQKDAALFRERALGEELHLTFRIPAFEEAKMHRLARAFMNILSLADFSEEIGLPHPMVTEMFLPLTTSADQPRKVRQAFQAVAAEHEQIFHAGKASRHNIANRIMVTPLVEEVESLLNIENIVKPYWTHLLKEGAVDPSRGIRIFLARSDPAMNAGLVPAVLAAKMALATVHTLGERLGIAVHPIIGTGSLPFRGSVNPSYLDTFLPQYAGTSTYSIQSAFRYDYPLPEVRMALERMREEAPKHPVTRFTEPEAKEIHTLCSLFMAPWKAAIEALAPLINGLAAFVPPRRERLQHIGLFGYSRGIGTVKLPRAIGFTAALYSIGLPPELIVTGRGLAQAKKQGLLEPLLTRYYPALPADLRHAAKYFNRENLGLLASQGPVWQEIAEDVRSLEQILGVELGPEKPHHVLHRNLSSNIFQRLKAGGELEKGIGEDVVEAARIRRSLG